MLFWIVSAALTAGVILVLTRPLSASADDARDEPPAADLEVYRDQLREIDADAARGLLSAAEAEAARIEVSRRILALEDKAAGQPQADAASPLATRASYAIAAAVPLIALALYVAQGSPGMPGRPAAERLAATPFGGSPINELIERVEARLREHPDDGQGWDVIAPVYFRLERFHDAAHAYTRAIALLGETPKRLAGVAEAKVMAQNGVVGEDARKAFERLIALEPDRPEARFWLAMAKEQDGNLAGAADDYRSLLAEAPQDASWRLLVEQRLAAVTAAGRPAPDDGAGTAEQRQMIEAMVSGLAERLSKDGSDVAGWQRLLQSYTVLGRRDAALAALADARAALRANAEGLAEVEAFARNLGIEPGPPSRK